jgi:hypothetical protein
LHVTIQDIAAPVVLVGDRPEPTADPPVRVLVFQEGVLAPHVVTLLNRILADV